MHHIKSIASASPFIQTIWAKTVPPRGKSIGQDLEAKDLADNPVFEDDIKTLADVPVAFLWAALRKTAKAPISDATIRAWMGKNPKNFRYAFEYLTGIHTPN